MGVMAIAAVYYIRRHNIAVLNVAGPVAADERRLMLIVVVLSVIIAVPVFVMLAVIAYKYRESNTKATYAPDWDGNRVAETTWWLIPTALIAILAVITWHATHQLEPSRPLASNEPAMTIQVVAMQWKWLFIYPNEHIATVNYVELPVGRPVDFVITSDAPMNSFWIPQLGGQIYAMSGMVTQLHLEADAPGVYRGSSANISGAGFAAMNFDARAVPADQFTSWAQAIHTGTNHLTTNRYTELARPSTMPTATYAKVDSSLYNQIVMQYGAMNMGAH